jgi:hypothetical protein
MRNKSAKTKTRKPDAADTGALHPGLVALADLLGRDLARKHAQGVLSESPRDGYDGDSLGKDPS